MKRFVMVLGVAAGLAGCSGQKVEQAASEPQELRLGAGDELGWQLQTHDRAVTSASAEERDLASHE